MGPQALAHVLRSLTLPTDPNLLIGLDVSDDAAVYRLSDDTALVQTVDFFPPIVDDPYTFGAIAAANALSDVFAMGGRPILALAIAGFPEGFSPQIISAILQGGADKVSEAGAVVAGGHTIIDQEPKYGLCVTGLVHPERVIAKAGARPGDRLLLTKPLGTGVITTAAKNDQAAPGDLNDAIASMLRLNRAAAELAAAVGVRSGTDITGFGLLGHAAELAGNSGVGLRIDLERVPLLPGALEYSRRGLFPGGLNRNRDYLMDEGKVRIVDGLEPARVRLLFDPQTSGGMLVTLAAPAAAELQRRLERAGEPCWEIGQVTEGEGIDIA